jgi:hypothetical protein
VRFLILVLVQADRGVFLNARIEELLHSATMRFHRGRTEVDKVSVFMIGLGHDSLLSEVEKPWKFMAIGLYDRSKVIPN